MWQTCRAFVVMAIALAGCTSPTVAKLPDKTPTAATAASPSRYQDYPVGIGPCRYISVGEASEIVGMQLQYYAPTENSVSCVLFPAIGPGPDQPVVEGRSEDPFPNVWVTFVGWEPDWSEPSLGIGERSMWEAGEYSRIILKQRGEVARIDVNLGYGMDTARRRDLITAVARRVAPRLAVVPTAPAE